MRGSGVSANLDRDRSTTPRSAHSQRQRLPAMTRFLTRPEQEVLDGIFHSCRLAILLTCVKVRLGAQTYPLYRQAQGRQNTACDPLLRCAECGSRVRWLAARWDCPSRRFFCCLGLTRVVLVGRVVPGNASLIFLHVMYLVAPIALHVLNRVICHFCCAGRRAKNSHTNEKHEPAIHCELPM